jgi:hypothetical protein
MNKNKILSGLFMILAIIAIVGGIFMLVSYAIDVINIIVEFVTTTDIKRLASCGATVPSQFANIKADAPTLTLGLLYGAPLLLLAVSVLMFFAGYFYHKGKDEEEARKKEEIEREMIRKAAERVARQKAKEAEDAAAKAMEEELERPEEQPQQAEPEPSGMIVRKRRK